MGLGACRCQWRRPSHCRVEVGVVKPMAFLEHAAEAFALQVLAEAGFVGLVEHNANAQDAELVRRPRQTALPLPSDR